MSELTAKKLLSAIGVKEPFQLSPLMGGGNNRSFLVATASQRFFLKAYFHSRTDKRDRLRTEFSFCDFLWKSNVRRVPRPLAQLPNAHAGLYEYVEGRALKAEDITARRVKEAAHFFIEMNRHRGASAAKRLRPASEACFSIQDQLLIVGQRLARMRDIGNDSAFHKEARVFVREKMTPAWADIVTRVTLGAEQDGVSLTRPLPQSLRCLSPSDFGFHNALITPRGPLRFVDFEYAGWDDIAKTICDFALQPRLPFPRRLLPYFCDPVFRFFGDAASLRERSRLLYPVFAFKWCCIMLNDFMPAGRHTRAYALGSQKHNQRLSRQLKRAAAYLKQAQGDFDGLR